MKRYRSRRWKCKNLIQQKIDEEVAKVKWTGETEDTTTKR